MPSQSNPISIEDSFYVCSATHLRRRQPLVLCLQVVHHLVEFVQVPVPKQRVVGQVELPSGVEERVVVSFSREVHPSALAKKAEIHISLDVTRGAARC
jgi:hypothetical protein